jgi:arsenate reductase (thioredoxin)
MSAKESNFYPDLAVTIDRALSLTIASERKETLQVLIDYIQTKYDQGQELHLNFICTHNSRRSHFAQIWAQTAAFYYGVKGTFYSGGVEVTEFNKNAVAAIQRSGFHISSEGTINPKYQVDFSNQREPILAFSKMFNGPINAIERFAAVLVCSAAEERCPYIIGAEQRILIQYEDPKIFDGTAQEIAGYDERSMQIASEMFYVFQNITRL